MVGCLLVTFQDRIDIVGDFLRRYRVEPFPQVGQLSLG